MKLAAAIAWMLILLPFASFADDFTLIDGREYKNAIVTRVEPDGIVVVTDSGVEKIPFTLLPKEVQDQYPYKPIPAAAPMPAQPAPEAPAASQPQTDNSPQPTGTAALAEPASTPAAKTSGEHAMPSTMAPAGYLLPRDYFEALLKAALALIVAVVSVLTAGSIATRLMAARHLRSIEKDFDFACVKQFDTIYSDFFAIWKLWNHFLSHGENALPDHAETEFPHATRWELLARAHLAEGSLDALFLKITSDRKLTADQVELMGRFRLAFQTLSTAIANNKPLTWNDPEHPDYLVFRRLASGVALLISGETLGVQAQDQRAEAFRQITSGRWERSAWPAEPARPETKPAH